MIERATEPQPEMSEDTETASIPLSMLGGQTPNPGDVVRLKVVSVDAENGSVTVAYDHGPQEKPMPKNTEAMGEQMMSEESES